MPILAALVAGAGGCAGALAVDFSSASLGTHADGALRRPVLLPFEGDGYAVPGPWRTRHANYGTEELVGAVVRAARAVDKDLPGGVAAVGDLSHRTGGGTTQHRSHQSGRDVDIFYYAMDGARRPVKPGEAMLHYSPDGRAVRWSPPKGVRPPAAPVPAVRFDAPRNWAFVRALLVDPGAEVQWIFMQRGLAASLLATATAAGEDPALVARAAFIIHEPSDSEPHDDHMHVRLYCAAGDRPFGCTDRGPVRWWKKMWKYMRAPFGRGGAEAGGEEAIAALARSIRGELPAIFVPGVPTS